MNGGKGKEKIGEREENGQHQKNKKNESPSTQKLKKKQPPTNRGKKHQRGRVWFTWGLRGDAEKSIEGKGIKGVKKPG